MTTPVASVLIVDDEIDLCESVQFIFDDGNYRTFLAHNVGQAFQLVKDEEIDFVVSDIRMPGESGLDLLKKIKDYNPISPQVILVTGYSDVKEAEAKAAGAVAMIRKPVMLEDLFETVERLRTSRT